MYLFYYCVIKMNIVQRLCKDLALSHVIKLAITYKKQISDIRKTGEQKNILEWTIKGPHCGGILN